MQQPTVRMRSIAFVVLSARHLDLYHKLKQYCVILPEPYGTRGWVVDLRDPFHPQAECYPSWAEADMACEQRIQDVLVDRITKRDRIT
jgi:hypothetical protein